MGPVSNGCVGLCSRTDWGEVRQRMRYIAQATQHTNSEYDCEQARFGGKSCRYDVSEGRFVQAGRQARRTMQSGNNAMEMIHSRCCQVEGGRKEMTVVFTLQNRRLSSLRLAVFWVGRLKEAVQSS